MSDTFDVPMGPREWDCTCRFGGGKVKAHLRQLTTEEEDGCIDFSDRGRVRIDKAKYVRLGCMSLTGLTVSGEAVTDGAGVCSTRGLLALLGELFVAVQAGSDLAEEERKN
uniref:Uncharacterized protein n=1 Tax=viral metagenome TaxID=1070528 RepID=A0A6M3IHK9_9ZZZZ